MFQLPLSYHTPLAHTHSPAIPARSLLSSWGELFSGSDSDCDEKGEWHKLNEVN